MRHPPHNGTILKLTTVRFVVGLGRRQRHKEKNKRASLLPLRAAAWRSFVKLSLYETDCFAVNLYEVVFLRYSKTQ